MRGAWISIVIVHEEVHSDIKNLQLKLGANVKHDCSLLRKALILRFILWQEMIKVDLRDLIVRRRFKIPAKSYAIHDTILKQILKQEPMASRYLKDTYFTYTRNGYFRFDYQTLFSINLLTLKRASITLDNIQRCKIQLGDNTRNTRARSSSITIMISTPLEIAYAILSEDLSGCSCEVVGYPLLYELVQRRLLKKSPSEIEVRDSILRCDDYLTKTFVMGLEGTDLKQVS
jgi:hypothetical protein